MLADFPALWNHAAMHGGKVTLADIARQAGVAKTTASYALRNHPSIGKATRLRLQKIARELGYRPDPLISKLMSHLQEGRSRRHTGVLAFLNMHEEAGFVRNDPIMRQFHASVRSRAAELGYGLEDHWYHDPKILPPRLADILHHRGIEGLILGSSARCNSKAALPWEKFAAVTVGYSISQPPLHRVSTHHYKNMRLAISRVRSAGFRRLGFVINRDQDKYMEDLHLACALVYNREAQPADRIDPLVLNATDPAYARQVTGWFKQSRPDAILSAGLAVRSLEAAGLRIPSQVPAVELPLFDASSGIAGVHPCYDRLGVLAVNLLAFQLDHDAFGLPETPEILQMEGRWHEGASFPSAGGAAQS